MEKERTPERGKESRANCAGMVQGRFYLGKVVKPVSDLTEYTLADLREHIEFKLNQETNK